MQIKLAGGDIGNDALKIALLLEDAKSDEKKDEDKLKTIEVMNVVSSGYKRRILGEEKQHLSNLLDVNISVKNNDEVKELGHYFVGGIAYKYGRDLMERNAKEIKAENEDTIILLVTGLAYGLFDPQNPIKTENVALGTLLPTEEYFNEENDFVSSFEGKLLNKTYIVKFNSPNFKNGEITINFIDDEILPEGAAAQLAHCYNVDGLEKPIMKEIKDKIYLGVVIGSITTELCIFDHGEFDSKGFIGIPVGTSIPLDSILVDLRSKISMSRHQLDYIIRNDKKLIINDKNATNGTSDLTLELKKYKAARFRYFVKLLVNKIYSRLSENGVNTDLLSGVNLGGGGTLLILDEFKKEFKKGNVTLIENARFANAIGALIAITQKRKQQATAENEIFEQELKEEIFEEN